MNAPMMNGQEENLLDGVIILVRTENALNSTELTKTYCPIKRLHLHDPIKEILSASKQITYSIVGNNPQRLSRSYFSWDGAGIGASRTASRSPESASP
jgi:hypothetical protein